MMSYRIGPRRCAALIVSVKHQTCFWIIQMPCIDDQLFRCFIVGISSVVKQLAISGEKRHRHEHAVSLQLPLAILTFRMPKPTVVSSLICVELFSNPISRKLILRLQSFLMQEQ